MLKFHKPFVSSYQLSPFVYKYNNTTSKQSIPKYGFFSYTYLDLASATALIGFKPELSAKHVGMPSNASANALTAYYSTVEIFFNE